MKRILISWVGGNDLKASKTISLGPIAATLKAENFDELVLLYNYPKADVKPYLAWLDTQFDIPTEAHFIQLRSPIDFGDIYQAANQHLELLSQHPSHQLSILISPGTPAMQAVWILLGKTRYLITFYQSTLEQGVQKINIPFNIAAEYIPEMSAKKGQQLQQLAVGQIPVNAAFDDIITKNPQMETLKAQASMMAQRDVPVLIYGETGTGKELFATAIHNASSRKDKSLVILNCGAIPPELIDSTLFGYMKGAFTGANADKKGLFQQADGGTIFLDEFGELPKDAQVRLLRVLQNGEVTPVGSISTTKVNVRIIAATNRNLMVEVAEGRFREDLFYRVAVGVIHLPPLRDRGGDIGLLSDSLLKIINRDASTQIDSKDKKLSVKARKVILSHVWRGNIRELYSTLLRATLWAQEEEILDTDVHNALFQMPSSTEGILGREVTEGFELKGVMEEVAQHYISRALAKSHNKKKKAAVLLGLTNYQTLSNWIEKYNIK